MRLCSFLEHSIDQQKKAMSMISNLQFITRQLATLVLLFCLCNALLIPSARASGWSASFQNTDIHEFINTVSKNLNKTIIIEPSVKGSISVRSYQKLDDDRYYAFFLSVLEVYGFSVVNMPGGVLKVVPSPKTKGAAIPLVDDSPGVRHSDEIIMRVVPLHNVTGKDLAPLLRQLNDASFGTVVHYDPSNVLLLTGRSALVDQLVAIVNSVDKAGDHRVETVVLRYASAGEVARIAEMLLKSDSKNASNRPGASIVADERINAVIISGEEKARKRMIATVHMLDVQGNKQGNTKVIYLQHAKAENLLEVLSGVSTGLQNEGGNASAAPAIAMMKNIVIKADAQTNALIINAAPDILRDLEQVISRLDIRRAQVLVEAVIVEVQDADAHNLGVQWFNQQYGGMNFPDTGTSITSLTSSNLTQALKGSAGLTTGFYQGDWRGLLTALSTNSQNDILATPSIVTLDNMEAEFNVGQDVPILTGSQTTSGDNVFSTVARKSVGIKLKVKPQINKGDTVLLEIEQEVSSVAEKAPDGTKDLGATFNTRTVKNAVLVNSHNTVVIGGLLDRSSYDVTSKVPWLGDLPGVGFLFRSNNQKTVKRNLMLFIRPSIIREQQNYNHASQQQLGRFRNEQDTSYSAQQLGKNLNNLLGPEQAMADLQADIVTFWKQAAP